MSTKKDDLLTVNFDYANELYVVDKNAPMIYEEPVPYSITQR